MVTTKEKSDESRCDEIMYDESMMFSWMDGVRSALGKRRMNVEAARVHAEERNEC